MERAGREARRGAAAARSAARVRRARSTELEQRDLGAGGRGVHDRLAAAARRRSCSRSSGCRSKRRGKTGFSTDARVLAGDPRRARDRPEDRGVARADEAQVAPTSTRCPALISATTAACTRPSTRPPPTTGRLSSTNPNLQNIPIRTELGREIRACFVAEDGCRLISADYSQVELRLLAHIAGEQVLKEIFRARRGRAHRHRREVLIARRRTRSTRARARRPRWSTTGSSTACRAFGLADRLQIPHEEAQEFIDRYLERFPAVQAFIDAHDRAGHRRGLRDARCSAAAGASRSCARATARRASWASGWPSTWSSRAPPPTSSRSRWCAPRRALRDAGLATRLVLQIHDELLFEGPERRGRARRRRSSSARWRARSSWTRRSRSTWASATNWLEAK